EKLHGPERLLIGEDLRVLGKRRVDLRDLLLRANDRTDVVHPSLDLGRDLRVVDEVHVRRGREDVATRRYEHVVGPDHPAVVGDDPFEAGGVALELSYVARPGHAGPRAAAGEGLEEVVPR